MEKEESDFGEIRFLKLGFMPMKRKIALDLLPEKWLLLHYQNEMYLNSTKEYSMHILIQY